MLHIGYHESSSGGYVAMGKEALSVGADTFAFFTRNPRGGKAKDIDPADAESFCRLAKENNFMPQVAHAPYTMNPCAAKEDLRAFALEMMVDDLLRLEHTPGCYYNFHPGSHVGQGAETGIVLTGELIAHAIRKADEKFAAAGQASHTTLLVETMAGKGSEIGKTFGEVRAILDLAAEKYGADLSDRLGVCLDTCHVWDGGYDVAGDLDSVIDEFDKTVGLSRLKAVHLNDSLNERGAAKDRHAVIGGGKIGTEALARVVNHKALRDLPFILETPNDHDGYKREIELMRSLYN